MPGDGRFLPAGIAAGVVALLVAPGWTGLAAVLGGMLLGQHLTIGVVQFGTAAYAVLMSFGGVVGTALRRVLVAPAGPWWRDRVTWAWVGGAVAIGVVLASIAMDRADNPF